jgi:hypothetical protein
MQARAFITQRSIDQHKTRRGRQLTDLTRRRDTDQQLGPGHGELLRYEHRERRTHRHAHDTDLDALEIDRPHLGVVARPPRMAAPTAGRRQIPDDVAVRIEHRNPGNRHLGQRALTPRLTHQIRRLEQRRRLEVLVLQQRRLLRCHGAHSNRRGLGRDAAVTCQFASDDPEPPCTPR